MVEEEWDLPQEKEKSKIQDWSDDWNDFHEEKIRTSKNDDKKVFRGTRGDYPNHSAAPPQVNNQIEAREPKTQTLSDKYSKKWQKPNKKSEKMGQ